MTARPFHRTHAAVRIAAVRIALAAAFAAGAAAASAQALQMRIGGWEMVYQVQGSGGGLPPGAGKLTPQQRAKLEAAMNAGARPRTSTAKVCLTKQDLEQLARDPEGDGRCTYSNVQRSASRWEGDMRCDEGRTGHALFEAHGGDRVSGSVTQQIPTDTGKRVVQMEVSGRWASASCKGYED